MVSIVKHFEGYLIVIDGCRYIAGNREQVYAILRQHNLMK